ncbi:pyridoxamine 5'-phosphate oxidase family protein [Gracilinema caldarium]|uniref:Pyridoxamine 5'-phosphate oxidase-related FMN-binding protein n=1 Tax=Gracilinema caldarium (strain ATCC 51460 / DSM 7334 / H1) TaxID=744872 RepID=F8EX54_GRAC1|nr:pyridoxamine 5'-phosphate oxidase family protein [Gracilinema caldarium]AEJ18797.1 pyridoxamine 5'-phosphate oxidase-related FMN-binding protein [Gracilinema caldarium DSM 7334]
MRRTDRELTELHEIYHILDKSDVLHLGLWDGHEVYVVPLNYVRIGDALYFHSAQEGRKVDVLNRNPRICFEVTGAHHIDPGSRGADCTTHYESVIGWGTVNFVTDYDKKYEVLCALNRKFGSPSDKLPEQVVQKTAVVEISIVKLTGKANRGSM